MTTDAQAAWDRDDEAALRTQLLQRLHERQDAEREASRRKSLWQAAREARRAADAKLRDWIRQVDWDVSTWRQQMAGLLAERDQLHAQEREARYAYLEAASLLRQADQQLLTDARAHLRPLPLFDGRAQG